MEVLYLDCGRRRPQLKRNPLGGATLARSHCLVLWLLAAACTTHAGTLPEARSYPSPTIPQPPLTVVDTVIRLALDSSTSGLLQSQHEPYVISSDGNLTPHVLPSKRGAKFILLSPADIQQFADDHGDLGYLKAGAVWATVDTAIVTVTQTTVFRRPDHQGRVVRGGGSICEWLAIRRAGEWVLSLRNYIVLD